MSNLITLDVGGKLFKTSVSVLQKYPDSMLSAMFDHEDQGMEPLPKTENGHYFLDADPEDFRVILNFLRIGKVVSRDTKGSMEGIFALADYLGLQEVVLEGFDKSSAVVLDLNGEKKIKIARQQLTKVKGSKMAEFFSGQPNELSQWIVKESENRYFISRPKRISEMVFDFMKSFNKYYTNKGSKELQEELKAYGLIKNTHWKLEDTGYLISGWLF